MDQYHTLTKSQAADAYKRAQRAMLGGFAILVVGAIVTLQQDSPEATIAGGGLTGLGAVLAGYIGKTFLDVYRRALAQLNFYFEQPLVSSYLITAERLTQNVSEQRKDDALLKIVDRILTATISRSSLPLSQSDSAQWPSNEPGKAVEE